VVCDQRLTSELWIIEAFPAGRRLETSGAATPSGALPAVGLALPVAPAGVVYLLIGG